MKMNEGGIDRVLRVVVGIGLLVLAFLKLGVMDGSILGIVAAAIGTIALLTGLAGFCPAYMLLGLKTCPLKK
ncbi:hypothetical protein MNBD_PLANCTO03-91 [hydrothermal vent metagenome]|uniref:Inner membrane protein YgaP-like transmembrane domain-containing protein n=1 Tax=hydrothermal vent metagenome TaxID=652676 RepID=A0A3B1E6F2_9ZZZZ